MAGVCLCVFRVPWAAASARAVPKWPKAKSQHAPPSAATARQARMWICDVTPLVITRAQPLASLRRSRGREITRGLWTRVTHVDSCDSVSAHSARDIKSTSRYLGSLALLSHASHAFFARASGVRGLWRVRCVVGQFSFIHSNGKYKYF